MSKKLFISFQKPSTIIPQLTKSRRTFLNRRSSTKPIRLKLTPYKRRYITIFQRITFSHRLQTTIRCRNRGEFQFFQLLLPARRRYFFIFNFRITKTKCFRPLLGVEIGENFSSFNYFYLLEEGISSSSISG